MFRIRVRGNHIGKSVEISTPKLQETSELNPSASIRPTPNQNVNQFFLIKI